MDLQPPTLAGISNPNLDGPCNRVSDTGLRDRRRVGGQCRAGPQPNDVFIVSLKRWYRPISLPRLTDSVIN